MKVREKRIGHPAHGFGPVLMTVDAVDAYSQNLGVCPFEFAQEGLNSRDLQGSGGGPIQGIKHEHDVFIALELAQLELLAVQLAGQLEIRRLLSDLNHSCDPSSFPGEFRYSSA